MCHMRQKQFATEYLQGVDSRESWCVLALLVAAVYSAYASDSDKTGVRILFWQSLSTTKGDCPQTWMGHGNY